MADKTYYLTVKRILIILLAINVSVAAVKGIYGIYTNTLSMTTDGLHSLFDGTSNVIGIIGIALASRPPDKDHPYGHSKVETFATGAVAVLLFATCIQVLEASFHRFLNPQVPDITTFSFLIMGTTLAVNVVVTKYEYFIGKKLKSNILVADSMHTRSDVYASIAVILGLLAIKYGYPIIDPVVALIITGLILHTGIEIIKESSDVLLDKALLEPTSLKMIAESVDGVCDCHKVRSRGSPAQIYVDLHVSVDPSMTIEEAHDLGKVVESRIRECNPEIKDIVIHLEPKGGGKGG